MTEFRLLTRPELESVPGMSNPVPSSLWAMGAVDERGVAACIGVFFVLHADPIWIRPDRRNGGKLPLELWQAAEKEILFRQAGPEVLWTSMIPGNPGPPTEDLVERMIQRAGGWELCARFFTIPVRDKE